MDNEIRNLKSHLVKYREVEAKLADVNKQASAIRNDRKLIENDMIQILSKPEFKDVKTLQIQEDGTQIKVQHPETWSKGWHLSKKDLEELLYEYFDNTHQPNALDCSKFIIERQSKKLVSREFAFITK